MPRPSVRPLFPVRSGVGVLALVLLVVTLIGFALPNWHLTGAHADPSATPTPTITASPAGSPTGTPTSPASAVASTTSTPTAAPTTSRTSAGDTEGTPLQLRLATMIPAVITDGEDVAITGTITNTTAETWTDINLHPFRGDAPLTTAAEVSAAAATPEDSWVGSRITTPGTFATIARLGPGDTETFSVTVPAGEFPSDAGVYWVGVHALGNSSAGRDDFADGRARTFIPRLPPGAEPVRAALVLPLRALIQHTADGRVARPTKWARLLSPGGRLDNLLQAGLSAGDRPISWLIDPALIQAIVELRAGNTGLSVEPLPEAQPAPDDQATPSSGADPGTAEESAAASALPRKLLAIPTATPTPAAEASVSTDPSATPVPTNPAAAAAQQAATDWLIKCSQVVPLQQPALVLPYGDVDVSATARYAPSLLSLATARSAELMAQIGLQAIPAIAPARGYLDPAALTNTPPETVVLISDAALDPAQLALLPPPVLVSQAKKSQSSQSPVDQLGRADQFAPAAVKTRAISVSGRQVIAVSAGVAAGGPGPEPAGGPIAVRQRILSEAAITMLGGTGAPLVIVPPPTWDPAEATSLFASLDAGAVQMVHLDKLMTSTPTELPPETLVYPVAERARELTQTTLTEAVGLLNAGTLVDSVLALPSRVAAQTSSLAFTQSSEQARRAPAQLVPSTRAMHAHVQGYLDAITVDGPPTATLTSNSGKIGATVTNGLDVAVTVLVNATTDKSLKMTGSSVVTLAPRTHRRLLLQATTDRPGVHKVTLRVRNADGTAIGTYDSFTMRAAQFSRAIWLSLLGTFALIGALFAWRVFLRIQVVRREGRDGSKA